MLLKNHRAPIGAWKVAFAGGYFCDFSWLKMPWSGFTIYPG